MTITLDDVAYLLHLIIRGRLLKHFCITRDVVIELMVDYLGAQLEKVVEYCSLTNGAHVKFSLLKDLYHNHLVAAVDSKTEGDDFFVQYHCWHVPFVDKSDNYVDVTYLRYFMDLDTGRIISHFHHIHGFDLDLDYTEGMSRVAMYLPHRRNQMLFEDHREIIPFDSISLYSGWLACGTDTMVMYLPKRCMRKFGYVQTIPKSPSEVAPDTIVRRDLDDIIEDWEHHMAQQDYRLMQASSS
ncbi:uncharacterized protein LOC131605119 [Vicia villosa]|uniref:uncharacterized protein LOC131605119 n=1 Tax=Vicia villosa TaxID=3911 RepID=UPI00273B3020|nr:uncharacterized protein LOC131605119 [Vicia villosa]